LALRTGRAPQLALPPEKVLEWVGRQEEHFAPALTVETLKI
jgi:hypothetical protein